MAEISTKWKRRTLEEIAEIWGGGTPARMHPEWFTGDIPWATPTDVTALDGYLLYDTKEYITQEAVENSSTRLLPTGTVLLTSRATIGSVAIAMRPMCTNQGFANLICGPEVNNRYLAWFLRSIASYLKDLGGTTTFPEISKSTLRKVFITYPVSPTKQQYIADLLDAVDIARRLCNDIVRGIENLISSLFVKTFGEPERNPKGWNLVPLSMLVQQPESGWSPQCLDRPASRQEFGVIKLSAVTSGFFQPEENKALPPHLKPRLDLSLSKGDLLFSRANTRNLIGATALVLQW